MRHCQGERLNKISPQASAVLHQGSETQDRMLITHLDLWTPPSYEGQLMALEGPWWRLPYSRGWRATIPGTCNMKLR